MLGKLIAIQTLLFQFTLAIATRYQARQRTERGEALPWLIVIVASVGIAYFAGDAVLKFAKEIVNSLGT